MGLIYKVTNKVNGKVYIGLTNSTLAQRKNKHLNEAEIGKGFYFHNALRKYGKENFTWEVVEDNIPDENLGERELYWISRFNSFKTGYNQTEGGEGCPGRVMTKETRKRIGIANKGKYHVLTPGQEDAFCRMYQLRCYTKKCLLKAFGISHSTGDRILQRSGIKRGQLWIPKEIKEKVKQLYISGKGPKEISNLVKLTNKQVSYILEDKSIISRGSAFPQNKYKEVEDFYIDNDFNLDKVAGYFDICKATVRKILKSQGVFKYTRKPTKYKEN